MKSLSLLCLMFVACRTRPYDSPDEGGSPPDLASCTSQHALQVVPLSSIGLFNNGNGAMLRVIVRYPLRSCDVRGQVDVIADGGTGRVISLTAHAWIATLIDCGPSHLEARLVDISHLFPDETDLVFVRDGGPSGTATLEVTPSPTPMSICGQVPTGLSTCVEDCECSGFDNPAPIERCLVPRNGTGVCGIPCADDADCPVGFSGCDIATGACATTSSATTSCIDGWSRDKAGACRPAQATVTDGLCECDADCGLGGVCSANRCAIPCASDADCRAGGAGCGLSQCG